MLEVHTDDDPPPGTGDRIRQSNTSDTGLIVPFDHGGSRSPVEVQNVLSKELPSIRRRPVRPTVLRYTARLLRANWSRDSVEVSSDSPTRAAANH